MRAANTRGALAYCPCSAPFRLGPKQTRSLRSRAYLGPKLHSALNTGAMLTLPLALAGGKPPAPPRSRGAFAPLPATGRFGPPLRSRCGQLQRRHARITRASSLQVAFTPAPLRASPSLRSNGLRAHFCLLGLRPRAQKRARPLSYKAGAFRKP